MSGETEYVLKLSPYHVSVHIDVVDGYVGYSGMRSGPNVTGPSFVEGFELDELGIVGSVERVLEEVCSRIEHIVETKINYNNILDHVIEGDIGDMAVEQECPGCNGKGKYIGAWKVEDPCEQCNGKGLI